MIVRSTIRSHLVSLTLGNLLILEFFFMNLFRPFFRIPKELYSARALKAKIDEGRDFDIVVDRSYLDDYEMGIAKLTNRLRQLWNSTTTNGMTPTIEYTTKQTMMWLVRFATIAAAVISGSIEATFFVSLIQFLLLPYSLSISLAYGIETILWGYLHHLLLYPFLVAITQQFIPYRYQLTITITPSFMVVFLVADQLLCVLCLFWVPKGTPKPIQRRKIVDSVTYGFLNCKTYYLILLPLCFGVEVPVWPWVLDFCFGITNIVFQRTTDVLEPLFYTIHRLGHLPHVYSDSHRFHHHLHDSTAFDAHIFGSGVTEEWLLLVLDAALALCPRYSTPGCFNPHLLKLSWYDKCYFHTRVETQHELDELNFHADHHTYHNKNFGASYAFEMFMNTHPKDLGNEQIYQNYIIRRVEDANHIKLKFTLRSTTKTTTADSKKDI